jgi:Outer membrane protein beta-barrel domain
MKKIIVDSNYIKENSIPNGLEYRSEYWKVALKKIRQHERRKFFKKVFCSSVLLIFLITILFEWKAFDQTMEYEVLSSGGKSNAIIEGGTLAEAPIDTSEIQSHNEVSVSKPIAIASLSSELRQGKITRDEKSFSQENNTIGLITTDALEEMSTNVVRDYHAICKEEVQHTNLALGNYPNSEFGRCYEALTTIKGKEVTTPMGIEPITFLSSSSPINQKKIAARWGVYVGNHIFSDFASRKNDWTWDVAAGVRFQKPIANKWALHTGLEYFTISGIRKPFSISSVAYDANSLRTTTTVQTSKLYYVSCPIAVQMKIAESQHVRLGCSISYMLTGKNEIKKELISYQSNTLVESYQDQGYVTGFEDFPVSIDFAYEKKLWRSAFLGLSYHWGITDVTKNEFFNNNSMDRNSRVLLVLGSKI